MFKPLATALAAGLLAAAFTPAQSQTIDELSNCASGPDSNASRTDEYSLKAPLKVVGLTSDGMLVCFMDKKPQKVRVIGAVNGLSGDTSLIGIDFRPQDDLLYSVGNAGGLYRIDTDTALATAIGALTVAPSGTNFGVDFNPAANALRIVSDTGQNLRQPFATMPLAATAPDATLNFTTTAAPGPAALGITAAAYTNNDLSAQTATTLFVIDSAGDRVAVQSPANAGFLVATGNLTASAGATAGFDIYSVLRGNVTVDQRALAALAVDGVVGLYDINLLTGKATPRGAILSSSAVVDIALPLNQN